MLHGILGGYKGYGLAAMVEIFCGILGGAHYGPNVRKWMDTSVEADLVRLTLYAKKDCRKPYMSANACKSSNLFLPVQLCSASTLDPIHEHHKFNFISLYKAALLCIYYVYLCQKYAPNFPQIQSFLGAVFRRNRPGSLCTWICRTTARLDYDVAKFTAGLNI